MRAGTSVCVQAPSDRGQSMMDIRLVPCNEPCNADVALNCIRLHLERDAPNYHCSLDAFFARRCTQMQSGYGSSSPVSHPN